LGADAPELDDGGLGAAAFASAAVAGQTSPRLSAERLRQVLVHVWDSPDGDLCRALQASGLATSPLTSPEAVRDLDPARALVAVVASEDQPLDRLVRANTTCLRAGVPWIPVGAFDGAVVQVGPLMIPGQTGCADCLMRRLAANVAYAEVFADVTGAPAAPTAVAVRSWSYSIAALVTLLWIATRDPDLPGRLYTLDPQDLSMRQSRVFRVPRCPICMAPDFVTAPAPWSMSRDH
jgi:bacteriocin biosynthesis cyclodehydratase domain-containing protein